MFPQVRLSQDIELDMQMTRSFLLWSKGGLDFTQSIYGPNPGLKNINADGDRELQEFFTQAYQQKQQELDTAMHNFQAGWDAVEEAYINLTRQIFHNHPFPEGEYVGYMSINNCNPRFLDDKTFQIFYRTDTPNRTISHELMHFIFYDYCAQKFPDLFGEADPNSGAYWSLAELFNNVMLSFSDFQSILHNRGDHPYPDHERYYQSLVDLWNRDRDVDIFIPKAYAYLQGDESALIPPQPARFHHIVLFKIRDRVSDEDYHRALKLLQHLANSTPGMLEWLVTESMDTRKGRVIVEKATFVDKPAFEEFRISSGHQEAVELMREIADWTVGDYML